MKGFEVCNLTVQNALHQFPSLRGCACAWEDDLCDSVLVLAAQCHGKPGAVFSLVSDKSVLFKFCLPKGV